MISEENFIRHFPSVSGSNIILADAEPNQSEALKENLQEAFNQYGADIQHATERLDTFNSVTNTYLDIFMALGIIALLIGTIGIAIVIVKSIRSEKQQLAMLQALGIKRRDIISINVLSYTFLLISGIVAGAISTFFAVFPGLMNANAPVPLILLIVIISCILLNGIVWIIAGTKLSISKRFLADIRGE
jgi:ABC-type lipoprotein release transport system permease subunit